MRQKRMPPFQAIEIPKQVVEIKKEKPRVKEVDYEKLIK